MGKCTFRFTSCQILFSKLQWYSCQSNFFYTCTCAKQNTEYSFYAHHLSKENIVRAVAQCCQVHVFPRNWATLTLLPAGCFSCLRVEATSIMWYSAPEMRILPCGTPPKHVYFTPGTRLIPRKSDWANFEWQLGGFVVKTWQPWQRPSS